MHSADASLHPVLKMLPIERRNHADRRAQAKEWAEIWEAERSPHTLAFLKV